MIDTEPSGSIQRPVHVIDVMSRRDPSDPVLERISEAAIRNTIASFEDTGTPGITDGEQRNYHNFRTCPVEGTAFAAEELELK